MHLFFIWLEWEVDSVAIDDFNMLLSHFLRWFHYKSQFSLISQNNSNGAKWRVLTVNFELNLLLIIFLFI